MREHSFETCVEREPAILVSDNNAFAPARVFAFLDDDSIADRVHQGWSRNAVRGGVARRGMDERTNHRGTPLIGEVDSEIGFLEQQCTGHEILEDGKRKYGRPRGCGGGISSNE